MPSNSLFTRLVLLSPAFVAIFYFGFSPVAQGLREALPPLCDSSPSGRSAPLPFAPEGTRNDWGWGVNDIFCPLVTIFEASTWPPTASIFSSQPSRVIVIIWMSYIPTVLALIHLVAQRHSATWVPPVLGVYQWFSAALSSPLLGAFLLPRLASSRPSSPHTRASIEGLAVGLLLGYFLPSWFLLFWQGEGRQEWIAGWQFLPVWVWLGQEGWKWIRRRIDGPGETRPGWVGKVVLAGMLGGASLGGHVVVLNELYRYGTLRHLLPPLYALSDQSFTGLSHAILTYDLLITVVSVIINVVYLSSSVGGGRGGSVGASFGRVLVGTMVGGLGVGVGAEFWRFAASGGGE